MAKPLFLDTSILRVGTTKGRRNFAIAKITNLPADKVKIIQRDSEDCDL